MRPVNDSSAARTCPPLRVIAWPAFKAGRINPYSSLFATSLQAMNTDVSEFGVASLLRGTDILHVHWPEYVLANPRPHRAWLKATVLLMVLDLLRMRGTKVVWTAHNLGSHENRHPKVEEWFWRAFTKRVDGVLALSESGLIRLQAKYTHLRQVPASVAPHGHYRAVYPIKSKQEARRSLGISDSQRVLAYFGVIREYKNVPRLLMSFSSVEGAGLRLLVAGAPVGDELRDEVVRQASLDSRVNLRLGVASQEELAEIIAAADLVVLPYSNIENSGSALLALSLNRPVLVPEQGSLSDLKQHVGDDWVRTYTGEINGPVILEALEWLAAREAGTVAFPASMEWEYTAAKACELYARVRSYDTTKVT